MYFDVDHPSSMQRWQLALGTASCSSSAKETRAPYITTQRGQ